ncbi:PrgI family mobile element protein [Collibacillus ludicampi]|uniref:PrgI family mobile element protein n=1 Tax=Collibacillus ludicampi TaxID=2771369 RepID=UPI0024943C32|nr:PrgI family protein [Collibacillus ludicampi]
MRVHSVPVQLNEDEKIIGGRLTLRQIGFLASGILVSCFLLFLIKWIHWTIIITVISILLYQTLKFTFFKKFGWDYYIYWIKLRRCKKRRSEWIFRKGSPTMKGVSD